MSIPTATVKMGIAFCSACRHISAECEGKEKAEFFTEQIYGENYSGYVPTNLSSRQCKYNLFMAEWLAQFLPKKCRVLEIGCHDGFFLSLLQKKGFECEGIEPSPFADIAVKKYGIKVKKDFFRKGIVEKGAYDVVILKHIVEHVPDPIEFLQFSLEPLKRGGFLYVEVPNSLGSLEGKFYPEFHVDHISYFTFASLMKIMEICGLNDIVHIESFYGYMQFPFLISLARKGNFGKRSRGNLKKHSWCMDFRVPALMKEFTNRFKNNYLPNLKKLGKGRKLAVWGTGSIGHQFAMDSGWGMDDVVYVDPNPVNQGKFLSVTGHEVLPIEAINEKKCDTILIASGWEDDVREQIKKTIKGRIKVLSFYDLIKQ
ncbi:methyltransferase domain-containing protein [Candidatus Peregrinibacteria bacterium]|nr:methyltransferase domain-containing protein [Candidatus Peregrinibacteria bacterium]